MENTFQPSLPSFRTRMAAIEAMELATIGFLIWGLGVLANSGSPLADQVLMLFVIQGALLGSWGIYNLYIRLSRAGGRFVDYGLWLGAFFLTGSYTLWCWIILDINRLILAKLLYRGEAPVEYAVSWRSKLRRKLWEQMQKTRPA